MAFFETASSSSPDGVDLVVWLLSLTGLAVLLRPWIRLWRQAR